MLTCLIASVLLVGTMLSYAAEMLKERGTSNFLLCLEDSPNYLLNFNCDGQGSTIHRPGDVEARSGIPTHTTNLLDHQILLH